LGAVNTDFHWESVKKAEVGIDLGFFNDRLIVNAARWNSKSSNQLGSISLPATTGATIITANQSAKIENSGWDITLSSVNVTNKIFSWSTSGNIGIQRNKLLSLPEDAFFSSGQPLINYYKERNENPIGKPFAGMTLLYKYMGVDPATGLYSFQGNSSPISTDPFDVNDNIVAVTTIPKFSGGISNTLKYKSFSLSIFLQFTKQTGVNYIYDGTFSFPGKFNTNQPSALLGMTFWEKQGDNAELQKLTQVGFPNGYNFTVASGSDLAYTDASFIRLKNLYFSYELPSGLKQKLKVKSCNFFIQGQNILTITHYKGFDPEVPTGYSLPQLRTFMAGLSLTL